MPVSPFTRVYRSMRVGLAGRSLNERSINLDGTFPASLNIPLSLNPFLMVKTV